MAWDEKKLKKMLKEKAGEIKPWTGQEWADYWYEIQKDRDTPIDKKPTLAQVIDVAILTA